MSIRRHRRYRPSRPPRRPGTAPPRRRGGRHRRPRAGTSPRASPDLADRGVAVLAIDYDDPASLERGVRGADRILLISASEPGRRARAAPNAIDAAARAGAGLLAYTSIANAGTTTMRLAAEHQATEAALRASGLTYVLLRNSWYLENYTAQVAGDPAARLAGGQRGRRPGQRGHPGRLRGRGGRRPDQ